MFCINVILTVRDEANVDKVRGLLTECGRLSRQEPGCISYEACHSQADRKVFMLVERWESEEAWKAHRNERAYKEIYHPQVIPLVERVPHISDLLE
jgi:quinol monooxygenase YgiN